MAYLPPNEENTQAPTGQTTANPLTQMPPVSGGSAGAGAGAPKAGAAPGVGTPTQFGTSSTKLGDYLSANAPQIQQQAGTISGNLGTQYGQQTQGVQGAVNQFGQQVKGGYAGFDQAAIDKAIQSAAKGTVGDQDVQAVQGQLKNQYAGPLSFQETSPYSQVQADVNKAAQNAQLLTTQPGIRSYYQGNYGQEAPGMATLDTALLTSSPEAYGQVKQAAAPFAGLSDYLAQQTAQANTAVPAAQQEIAQGKAYTGQALTGQEQAVQSAIDQAVKQAQETGTTQNKAVLAALQNRNPGAAELATLGIDQNQWNALKDQVQQAATAREFQNRNATVMSGTTNIDLAQFLQQQNPSAAYTAANVATPEQLAQAKALQQLAAGQWSGNPLEGVDKVGGAPTNLNAFDYQAALNQSQATNKAQSAAAQAFADALQAGMDVEHAQAVAANTAQNYGIAGTAGVAAMGLPGAPIAGGVYGYGTGAYDAAKAAASKPTIKNVAEALNATVGVKGIANAAQGAVQGVVQAVNTISNVFCFEGHTEVEMADGTTKEIKKIDLGDNTKGGEVLGTIQAYVDSLYTYDGVEVSGKHAVKENGKWIRVEDSELKRFKTFGKFKVYCLVTSKHRIFSRGIEFSDYVETDDYENLTIQESLEKLNVA